MIVRGFYGPEHGLVIDVLVRNRCVKEEDIQAKFNEQMEPIYKLLKDTENVRLAMEVLEPEPTIIPHLHPNAKPNAPRQRPGGERQGGSGHWTDVKTPGVDYHQEVIINIGDENPEKNEVKAKEMLMMQERGAKPNPVPTSSWRYSDDNRSDTSESGAEGGKKNQDDDDDEDDDDFEEVDDNDPIVTVAGQEYSYSEVANKGQELIQLMTAEEKERYIEIGQRMYEDMDH